MRPLCVESVEKTVLKHMKWSVGRSSEESEHPREKQSNQAELSGARPLLGSLVRGRLFRLLSGPFIPYSFVSFLILILPLRECHLLEYSSHDDVSPTYG